MNQGSPLIPPGKSGAVLGNARAAAVVEGEQRQRDDADWSYWLDVGKLAVEHHKGRNSSDADLIATMDAIEKWLRKAPA